MRKYSLKRQKENREYSKLRVAFLAENPHCEGRLAEDCTGYSTDLHHSAGRVGKNLTDTTKFKALCRLCHLWAEAHPKKAKELGLSESRLAK